jgi:hypothetical protein
VEVSRSICSGALPGLASFREPRYSDRTTRGGRMYLQWASTSARYLAHMASPRPLGDRMGHNILICRLRAVGQHLHFIQVTANPPHGLKGRGINELLRSHCICGSEAHKRLQTADDIFSYLRRRWTDFATEIHSVTRHAIRDASRRGI